MQGKNLVCKICNKGYSTKRNLNNQLLSLKSEMSAVYFVTMIFTHMRHKKVFSEKYRWKALCLWIMQPRIFTKKELESTSSVTYKWKASSLWSMQPRIFRKQQSEEPSSKTINLIILKYETKIFTEMSLKQAFPDTYWRKVSCF